MKVVSEFSYNPNEADEKIIDEAIEESKENSHYLSELKRLKKQ
ncbi:hypothetical protein [Clostridium estertheticum]|nr:hypothetical protein [Clostridium estertheticum]